MANNNDSGEFRPKNGLVKSYWEGVRVALNAPLQVHETLLDGFWLALRVTNDEFDRRKRDGKMREGDVEDASFVRCKRDCP